MIMRNSIDLLLKDRGRRPEEGGGWTGAESNSFARTTLCLKFKPKAKTLQEGDKHTDQQYRNDLLEVTNTVEKECDQLDTQLAKYGQNRGWTSG
jgi:hypothetical protein